MEAVREAGWRRGGQASPSGSGSGQRSGGSRCPAGDDTGAPGVSAEERHTPAPGICALSPGRQARERTVSLASLRSVPSEPLE